MGAVYRVRAEDGQELGLKASLGAGGDKVEAERFKREIEALTRLKHPNIIRLLDQGSERGIPFYVMELVEGQDLDKIIQDSLRLNGEPPPEEQLHEIFIGLASAIVACHRSGIVHRDLKPHNVLVEEGSGRVVLIDFGVVRLDGIASQTEDDEQEEHSLTKTGEVVGTTAYMAPEQLVPKDYGPVGEATDVWGFGATLFHALTGKNLLSALGETNIFVALVGMDPPKVRSIRPGAPAWLAALCHRCLQKKMEARPDMLELLDLIEAGEPAPKRRSMGAIVALFVVAALAGLLFFMLRPAPLKFRSVSLPAVSKERSVTLRVSANQALSYRLEDANGKRLLEGQAKQGLIDRGLSLEEGSHSLLLIASGAGGTLERRFDLLVDGTPPRLEIPGMADQHLLLDERTLRGQIHDANLKSLSIDGNPIEFTAEGAFVHDLGVLGRGTTVLLVATDKAGNELKEELEILSPAAIETSVSLLDDLRAWDQTSSWLQDAVIEAIARRLAPRFLFLQTRRYQASGQSHRIATFIHLATGAEMNLIPGGRSSLGLQDAAAELAECKRRGWGGQLPIMLWEQPRSELRIGPLLVGRFELRQGEWARRFALRKPSLPSPLLPVAGVSRDDVQRWLALHGDALRLPSEAEWEFAARGGSAGRFHWGSDFDPKQVWFKENTVRARPVIAHRSQSNAFGLSDTLGNVAEWCADDFLAKRIPPPRSAEPRRSPETVYGVARGGQFRSEIWQLRVTSRLSVSPSARSEKVGLRLFRDLFPPDRK